MKVTLRQERPESKASRDVGHNSIHWIKGLPFAMSPVGTLIHRVKSAKSHIFHGKYSHDSVTYWCGNGGCSRLLFDDPPVDRLLCTFCEAKAVAAGEKSASEIAGRHVHVGSMKPIRDCCKENRN